MHITFVKKILADGSPCRKCADVEARLRAADHWQRLDEVVVADERDPDSKGMRLARELGVDRAPFFVVVTDHATTVYTVYLKLLREVLGADPEAGSTAEAKELLQAHPELDLL